MNIHVTHDHITSRFWSKVKTRGVNDCWEWQASKRGAYGKIRVEGVYQLAHRVAWVLTHGAIEDGKWVLHRCDNPGCVNPKHLFLGTVMDNYWDMRKKKRWSPVLKTHCKRGHLRTDESSYTDARGWKRCRVCDKEKHQELRAATPPEPVTHVGKCLYCEREFTKHYPKGRPRGGVLKYCPAHRGAKYRMRVHNQTT